MNKRELVWLIVRLIGVYFAYSAIVSVFSVASAGSALYSALPGAPAKTETEAAKPPQGTLTPFPMPGMTPAKAEPEPASTNKPDPAAEKQKSAAFKDLLFYIFLTGIYGAFAFYLIRNGRILFDILNNESSVSRKQSDPAVTTLDL